MIFKQIVRIFAENAVQPIPLEQDRRNGLLRGFPAFYHTGKAAFRVAVHAFCR